MRWSEAGTIVSPHEIPDECGLSAVMGDITLNGSITLQLCYLLLCDI